MQERVLQEVQKMQTDGPSPDLVNRAKETARRNYETALKQTPNRYRGFWGAARAADAAGNRAQAADYFGKLVNLAKNADGERPEVKEAKAFLVQR